MSNVKNAEFNRWFLIKGGKKMRVQNIFVVVMLFVVSVAASYAGDHKMGSSKACFYDSNPGRHNWRYYYCGKQAKGCAGKKGNGGNDKHYMIYDGKSFTFTTGDRETYWCCGGTPSKMGIFVYGKNFYVGTRTERKTLEGGGYCNKEIKTTVCGTEEVKDCDEPDNCKTGLLLRNGECVKPCEGDEVFQSPTSNTCVQCAPNNKQGISSDRQSCIKCDSTIEFFDREKRECIKKNSINIKKYSSAAMQECWRCPQELFRVCLEAITTVNEMAVTGKERLAQIDAIATTITDASNQTGQDVKAASIVKHCKLEEESDKQQNKH